MRRGVFINVSVTDDLNKVTGPRLSITFASTCRH